MQGVWPRYRRGFVPDAVQVLAAIGVDLLGGGMRDAANAREAR